MTELEERIYSAASLGVIAAAIFVPGDPKVRPERVACAHLFSLFFAEAAEADAAATEALDCRYSLESADHYTCVQ